jgi:hypothetical protein
MRNGKTPKIVEGQSVDYAAIHAVRKGLSLYPPDVYTTSEKRSWSSVW